MGFLGGGDPAESRKQLLAVGSNIPAEDPYTLVRINS